MLDTDYYHPDNHSRYSKPGIEETFDEEELEVETFVAEIEDTETWHHQLVLRQLYDGPFLHDLHLCDC